MQLSRLSQLSQLLAACQMQGVACYTKLSAPKHLQDLSVYAACMVSGLQADSRQLQAGELFFAYPGEQSDGRNYLLDVLAQGCAAIICEPWLNAAAADVVTICEQAQQRAQQLGVPFLLLDDLAQCLGAIASCFYADPSAKMQIVGVTGTNGKTSVSTWVAAALTQQGRRCAVIGTLGCYIYQAAAATHGAPDLAEQADVVQQAAAPGTTPDALALQRTLAAFYAQGVEVVCMEVSSHALVQGRVNGVQFNVVALTQLSQDHLDYHGTMQDYAAAKARLFAMSDKASLVLNIADALGLQLAQQYADSGRQLFCYQLLASPAADLKITTDSTAAQVAAYAEQQQQRALPVHAYPGAVHLQAIALSEASLPQHAWFIGPWGQRLIVTQTIGDFNLENLQAVLAILSALGVDWQHGLACLPQLQAPAGRMQCFGGGAQPWVVVDYAHTPDALAKVLQSLAALIDPGTEAALWVVFGCGGERDRGKRAAMGAAAERYAQHIILTNDNPRNEDPAAIVAQIKQGMQAAAQTTTQLCLDRRQAIAQAIHTAKAGDIILVAGKGHECYQYIGKCKEYMSDAQSVAQALGMCSD